MALISQSSDTLDVGLTHIALPCRSMKKTIAFYGRYARMQVVHRRQGEMGEIVWLSDKTRPFVIVFLEGASTETPLGPLAHLGVGCESRAEVDRLIMMARQDGIDIHGPHDSGPPVGYWVFLTDPDGHKLELSYGQEVGLSVERAVDENT